MKQSAKDETVNSLNEAMRKSIALKQLFATEDGKTLDELLRAVCYVDNSTIIDVSNTNQMLHNEGCRSVYLRLQRLLKLDTVELSNRIQNLKKGDE